MSVYLARAHQALRTAQSNFAAGDTIGASSRAYYALFDAVRAVLSARELADVERIRTHRGISHVFHATVVQTGLIAEEVARVLPRALELRSSADYGSDTDLDREAVREVLANAELFIAACAKLIETSGRAEPSRDAGRGDL
jgi:uncharacterized protein (UPF0332 family)